MQRLFCDGALEEMVFFRDGFPEMSCNGFVRYVLLYDIGSSL